MRAATIFIVLASFFVLPFTAGYGFAATYSVSGTITFNGTPMSGFPVTLSVPSTTTSTNYVTTTTNSNGNYIFTGVSDGTYWLSASSACYNFNPVSQTITVNNANVTQNFTALSKSGPHNSVVSGVAADLGGVPISGVTITAYDTNCNNGITTTSNANGVYSFTTLGPSDYQFYPEMNGFGFYPSITGGVGGILEAGYWGLDRTVIHISSIPASPVSGANFSAYRPGDKVVSVPRTGQTISYDIGDDAYANAGVAWPAWRFTDNNDGTVTDGLTGLIWMKNAGCFSPAAWTTALTYANQLASGQCGLTDGSTAGQWRMPNAHELESIVDISQSNPAVTNGSPFTNINLTSAYWSSTSNMSSTPYNFANVGGTATLAMAIRFTDGRWIDGLFENFNNDKTESTNSLWAVKSGSPGVINLQATGLYYVMATGDDSYHSCPFCEGTVVLPGNDPYGAVDTSVAGDSASFVNSRPLTSPRMIDNGDGTIYDTVTGLTWLKKADCMQATWAEAISAVNNLANGQCGLADGSTFGQWRMPNRFEMLSLAQRDPTFPIATYYDGIYGSDGVTVIGPVIFSTFVASQNYWTSSTYASDTTQAWTVYSCDFGAYNMPKSGVGYTMAVRGGEQSVSAGSSSSSASYAGYLDIASCTQLAGWAWNANNPGTTVSVDIYDGTTYLVTVSASNYRADLAAAGIGNGNHAFSYALNFTDGKTHTINAYFSGTTTPLGNSLRTTSICSSVSYQGYLDGASCSSVSGWAWNPAQPATEISVDIYDGSTKLTTITAGNYRADLAAAGIGNGNHSFSYAPNFTDGKTHTINAYYSGTTTALTDSPQTTNTCSGGS